MRVHQPRVFIIAIVVALPLVTAPAAQAQQPTPQPVQRLSLDFRDVPLKNVLQALEKAGSLPHVAVPDGVGDMRVTVSLVDVTPADALTTILGQAGVVAIGGGYAETARDDTRNWAEWARWRSQIAQALLVPAPVAPTAKNPPATTVRTYRIIATNFRDILPDYLGGSNLETNFPDYASEDAFRAQFKRGNTGSSGNRSILGFAELGNTISVSANRTR